MAVSLTTVNAAITAIQDGGQTFTADGLTFVSANLNAYVALRDRLVREAARSAGTRPTMRGFSFRGMGYSDTGGSTDIVKTIV